MPAALAALPYAIWGAAMLTLLGIGLLLLPNGADYPFPVEATNTIETVYTWMYSLNMLLPVDTFAEVLYWGFVIIIFTDIIWPAVFWVFKTLTGGGQ